MIAPAEERAVTFSCAGETLVGVLHAPSAPAAIGVVIIVGGPQYRVGSHRQFALLARALAAAGTPVLRFDCRGMGDSDGEFPGFEYIAPDVAAAVDALIAALPAVRRVALWGLCDATLAICAHACRDRRIAGVALLNPWVRTEAGQARARLRHYYLDRVLQRDFRRKLISGRFNLLLSGRELLENIFRAWRPAQRASSKQRAPGNPLARRMSEDLRQFSGSILLILSGRDLTGQEFADAAAETPGWQEIFSAPNTTRHRLAEADHTFSRSEWRAEVEALTSAWIGTLR